MADDKDEKPAGDAKAEEKKEESPAETKEESAEEKAKAAGIEVEGAPHRKEEKRKPKEKKVEKKGKRVRTGRKHGKIDSYKFYKVSGDKAERLKKPCPRCGPGTWLAEHKGRLYCGRCHYTIFEKKPQ